MARRGTVDIYFDGGGRILIPVNPPNLKIKLPNDNTVTSVLSIGMVNILRTPGLKNLSFESFFPAPSSYFAQGADSIQSYVDYFEEAMDEARPIQFAVSGLGHPISMLVSVEGFDTEYDAGDDDCHYSLSLKLYRPHSAKVVQTQPKASPAPSLGGKPRENTEKKIAVGTNVIFNGRLHLDSLGNGPGQTRNNAEMVVHLIRDSAPMPYHLTTKAGLWQGWVTAGSVKAV